MGMLNGEQRDALRSMLRELSGALFDAPRLIWQCMPKDFRLKVNTADEPLVFISAVIDALDGEGVQYCSGDWPIVIFVETLVGALRTTSDFESDEVRQAYVTKAEQQRNELLASIKVREIGISNVLTATGPTRPWDAFSGPQSSFGLEVMFEIIRDDPDMVKEAVALRPEELALPYVPRREGTSDVQREIDRKLAASGGRLLLFSAPGRGKTRELVDLARRKCEDGWIVLVARRESENQLQPPNRIPPEYTEETLLLIFDDIHQYTDPEAYAARIAGVVNFLKRHMSQGSVYLVATASDEPHSVRNMKYDPSRSPWSLFGEYTLPSFTVESLVEVLVAYAEREQVRIEGDPRSLVEDSDQTLSTLQDNIKRAKKKGLALAPENWLNSRKQTWEELFEVTRADCQATDVIFQAIHLLQQAGLPARLPYVEGLAQRWGQSEVRTAIPNLVDAGLLIQRKDQLASFSKQQIVDCLQACGLGVPSMQSHWGEVADIVVAGVEAQPEWSQDLVILAPQLVDAASYSAAERVADAAIAHGEGAASVYIVRGRLRFNRGETAGAIEDLRAAMAACDTMIAEEDDLGAAYFNRALARSFLGDFAGAVEDFSRAMEHGNNGVLARYNRAMARSCCGDNAGAEEDFSAAIVGGHEQAAAYASRAMGRLCLGRFAEAMEDFRRAEAMASEAIALGTTDTSLYYFRGQARLILGDRAGAADDFTTLAREGLSNPPTRFWLAQLQVSRGQTAEAMEGFRSVEADLTALIDACPDHAFHYALRGSTRMMMGRVAEAGEDFSAAIERGQDDAAVYYTRGMVRLNLGAYAEAEQDFGTSIARNPHFALASYERGLVRDLQGKTADAAADFAAAETVMVAAIGQGVTDGASLAQLAFIRMQLGKHAEAEADFDAAIASGQRDALTLLNRGLVRASQGKLVEAAADFASAEELLTAFVAQGVDQAAMYVLLGQARSGLGKYADAEADYDLALARDPANALVFCLRGQARLAQGNAAGAEEDFTTAADSGQRNANLFMLRGCARLGLERYNLAEEDFSAAIACGAGDPQIYALRGSARIAQEKGDLAEEDLDTAITLGGSDPNLSFTRAQLRCARGSYTEAVEDLTRSLELDPTNVEVASLLGITCRRLGRWQEARAAYERALECDPARGTDWVGLADCAKQAGDEGTWREAIGRARELIDAQDAYNRACVLSIAGETDEALGALESALREHPELAQNAQTDPDLVMIREDPRFAALASAAPAT